MEADSIFQGKKKEKKKLGPKPPDLLGFECKYSCLKNPIFFFYFVTAYKRQRSSLTSGTVNSVSLLDHMSYFIYIIKDGS